MSKIRVKFLETRVVQDERVGTPDEEKYVKGKTYSLAAASANHWIKRGAAEPVGGARRSKPKTPKPDDDNGGGNTDGDGEGEGEGGDGEGGDGEGAGQTETT